MASREVHHADAIEWLRERASLTGSSVVTSLPDASEGRWESPAAWEAWFVDAAALVIDRVPDSGLAIFYQTDVKRDGVWVDKAALVALAVERAGAHTVFHKIVMRGVPRATTRGLAGYSHLIACSRGVRAGAALATPDVIAAAGPTTWTRGMGVLACRAACDTIVLWTPTRTVVDPFCGHGTVLAVANELGLDAVGVEIAGRRVRRARSLTLESLARPTP